MWHPQLVRLRAERGHPRHPVQIVLTDRPDLPVERSLLYTTPSLRVLIITGPKGAAALRPRLTDRHWIAVVDAGEPFLLRYARSKRPLTYLSSPIGLGLNKFSNHFENLFNLISNFDM